MGVARWGLDTSVPRAFDVRILLRIQFPLVLLITIIGLISSPPRAFSVDKAISKRILFMYANTPDVPAYAPLTTGFREQIRKDGRIQPEYFYEYLEVVRWHSSENYPDLLTDFLLQKYRKKTMDLIILNGGPAANFMRTRAERIFPEVPVIMTGQTLAAYKDSDFPATFVSLPLVVDFKRSVEVTFQTLPGTRKIYLVIGESAEERRLAAKAEEQLREYSGRVDDTYLNKLAFPALLEKVRTIGRDSVILFVVYLQDAEGTTFIPAQALKMISDEAAVPVFGTSDTHLGNGVVGGYMASNAALGKRAAVVGLNLLLKEKPLKIRKEEISGIECIFDWRELKRWGIDLHRLPEGSRIEFKEFSVWETYRWYILGAIALFFLQVLLIGGLMLNRLLRRRAEEEKEKLRVQLMQAQKMESVGRLAGGVAHDFNNMLSVILGNAELAMGRIESDPSLQEALKEIKTAAERSADLTQQLLAFARKQTIAPKVLDLNRSVEGMNKMLYRLIGEDIDLAWRPETNLWQVKIDPSQVNQILANLCVNARDAITGVGKITIETKNVIFDEDYCADHAGYIPGEYVLLAVSDNGCGMDKETINRLFEPFFTTKEMGKGTGLGLATIYGIVRQNNGFINVYSEPGRGTTFKICLPRYVGLAEQAFAEKPPEPAARGHETILLVEDEPTLLKLGRRALETQGYHVLAAATPGEALNLAQGHKEKIHLLITDLVMPEMNGRDLAEKLLPFCPELKILFMSGYTPDVIAHHGVLDESVHFLQKPFKRTDLGGKVRQVLDQD